MQNALEGERQRRMARQDEKTKRAILHVKGNKEDMRGGDGKPIPPKLLLISIQVLPM